jgi:hypothetical protein
LLEAVFPAESVAENVIVGRLWPGSIGVVEFIASTIFLADNTEAIPGRLTLIKVGKLQFKRDPDA